jgi:hypothetical protein
MSEGVAIVEDSERTTEDGAHVVNVKADTGGTTASLDHFAPPGVDALPLPGDAAALSDGAGTGRAQTTGYNDPLNPGRAKPGEVRVYGREPGGGIVNEAWFQGDGTIIVENAEGTIKLEPDGTIDLNGFRIAPNGDVTAPGTITASGEVSAMAATPATAVKLSTHLHPTGTGPSGPPQPGT